jgi:hypothetical protein
MFRIERKGKETVGNMEGYTSLHGDASNKSFLGTCRRDARDKAGHIRSVSTILLEQLIVAHLVRNAPLSQQCPAMSQLNPVRTLTFGFRNSSPSLPRGLQLQGNGATTFACRDRAGALCCLSRQEARCCTGRGWCRGGGGRDVPQGPLVDA